METNVVKLEDFFDFNSKEPINRLAYTKEDIDYKIKIIKKMQELGMTITTDKVGNICGSISVGNNPKKTLAIGSHTDSVYDGGQFDGSVGVIVALQTAEELLKSKNWTGTLKICIYSCEESSRFGNACVGSKYLNGNITENDFDKIVDQSNKTTTLKNSIISAKKYLHEHIDGVQEVDKIFDCVDYSLEAHTEQYQSLIKANKSKPIIGIINSVGSAVRVEYSVKGKSGHTGSTPMNKRKNAVDAVSFIGTKIIKLGKKYEKNGLGRTTHIEVSNLDGKVSFNQIPKVAGGSIDFRLIGENTPDKVLNDFDKIVKKVKKKTKTKIEYEVVSKGTPIITDSNLNSSIADVCDQNNIPHIDMVSYPGQDTGYIPAKAKTMIFIPSTGGSHNPKESTKKEFIETATRVFTDLSHTLLLEKFKDTQKVAGVNTNPVLSKDSGTERFKANMFR